MRLIGTHVDDPYQLRGLEAARRRSFFNQFTHKLKQFNRKIPSVPVSITAREPIPLVRGKPSIAHLSNDIVRCILNFVQDSSAEDVLKMASLSSSLYLQARYVQHRVVYINLDKRRYVRDRLELILRYGLLPAIRTLELSGNNHDELLEEERGILALLADMLPAMTGLRDLDWKVGRKTAVPIPKYILETLHPSTHLHASLICDCDTDDDSQSHTQAREFLSHITNNQNLFTLSVRIVFIHEEECLRTMRALKTVLLSCPNIRRIPMMDVWVPRNRCWGYAPALHAPYCGLGLSNGERPPALEEIGISEYPWGHNEIHPLSSFARGYPEKGIERDYWVETFDWSRVVRLNDVTPYLALLIAPKLTHLKEIVYVGQVCWDMTELLNEISSPLERLTITSWSDVANNPDSITRHGANLRQLKMHLSGAMRPVANFMTDRDLIPLCKGLPRLEELEIDIARNEIANDWPYESLNAISRLPCLRTAELWFELGTNHDPAPTPILTMSSAHHLFSYLRERNKTIQRLILHSGCPLYLSVDGILGWSMQNSMTFACTMTYPCDAEGGVISVTCPNLTKELNTQLASLAKVDNDWVNSKELDAKRVPLKVALEGPLAVDEWRAWQNRRWRRDHPEEIPIRERFILHPLRKGVKMMKAIRV